jgi:hypothetical protein
VRATLPSNNPIITCQSRKIVKWILTFLDLPIGIFPFGFLSASGRRSELDRIHHAIKEEGSKPGKEGQERGGRETSDQKL